MRDLQYLLVARSERAEAPVRTNSGGPANQKKARGLAIASQQRTNPNDYVSRLIPGAPGRFDFGSDFLECGIIKFLRAEGV